MTEREPKRSRRKDPEENKKDESEKVGRVPMRGKKNDLGQQVYFDTEKGDFTNGSGWRQEKDQWGRWSGSDPTS